MNQVTFENLWLNGQWRSNVAVSVSPSGHVVHMEGERGRVRAAQCRRGCTGTDVARYRGFTGVAEFLYLHRLGASPEAELDADQAIVTAARCTGISLTLLPTLFQHSDFGGVGPTSAQKPFIRSTPQFLTDRSEIRRSHSAPTRRRSFRRCSSAASDRMP